MAARSIQFALFVSHAKEETLSVVRGYAVGPMSSALSFSQILERLPPRTMGRSLQTVASADVGTTSPYAQSRYGRAALIFALAICLFSCASKQSLGVSSITILGPGVINDPKNKSLRVDILRFGLGSFCSEMLTRGVALKLSDDHPVVGRFFGKDCRSDMVEDDSKTTFNIKFAGIGYVWTNVTQRIGFDILGSVELFPDFQIADDRSMYAYFRPRRVETTQMKTVLVESSIARGAASLAGVDPDRLGREIFEAQVGRGFTVIRADTTGQIETSAGLLPLSQHTFHPFNIVSDDPVQANERTEIHAGQQDYLGGFIVQGNDKALSIVLAIDGAPGINLAVLSESAANQARDRYVHFAGPAPLVEPPRFMQRVPYGSVWKQTVPVPAGTYFLLLDNSSQGQSLQQASASVDDRAAKVDYLVQVVDAT